MPSLLSDLRNAIAFLSRLLPPSRPGSGGFDTAQLARAVPFYPPAGLILGAIACAPLLLPLPAWLAAWLYTGLLAWMTRGLHWDGLADFADACGSSATGERFWEIMKDSRIGAFGVMALVFGIGVQTVAAHACIEKGTFAPLLLAPAFGRSAVILFGRLVPSSPRSTLATLIQPGTQGFAATASLALAAAATAFFLGLPAFAAALAMTGAAVFPLRRAALFHGGANGDFYGTLIIATETAVLVSGYLL